MYHLLIFDFSVMSYKSLKLFTFFLGHLVFISYLMPYNHAKWNLALRNFSAGFLPGIFFKGGGVKFIVM